MCTHICTQGRISINPFSFNFKLILKTVFKIGTTIPPSYLTNSGQTTKE